MYNIEKLDNKGRGIAYINGKITFVPNTLPGEKVNIKIVKEAKKYNEGEVIEFITKSDKRREGICPYFGLCGGCELMHMTYEDTISYKKEKLESILYKYVHIEKDIDIIKSEKVLNYRNKITLKVENNKYGYYKNNTHSLVEIDNCLLAEDAINRFIKDIKRLNIKIGEVTIRSNYNEELLIYIKSKDKLEIDYDYLISKHKIVGVVLNGNTVFGESSFVECINNMYFQVSYDSFFQVNRNICSKLFDLILEEIGENETILDLYCGVGTLGINAKKRAGKVFGIEIIKNAILNAVTNAKINKRDNIYYMFGDVSKNITKVTDRIDTIIVDPPRAGLDSVTKKTILNFKAKKIIYVSCDPMTLARDLNDLQSAYSIIDIKGLDMFPMTQHCESITVLEKNNE